MNADTEAIVIKLDRNGSQDFFLALTPDRTINRSEASDEDENKPIMLIGKSDVDILGQAVALITPELSEWFGKDIEVPGDQGDRCELSINIYDTSGSTRQMVWRYYSGSERPPSFVVNFVNQVMDLTDPWFEKFKETIYSNRGKLPRDA
jgi:hypothetical protein